MSGLFHSTSVLGTFLAAGVGLLVSNWRHAFLIGVLPALLVVWVRARIHEPESWHAAKARAALGNAAQLGSFRDLFRSPKWARHAILGGLLAAVGLGTFWAVTIAGQDLAREFLVRHGVANNEASDRAKFAYGFVQALGAGVGMFAFGPLAESIGRRKTFILYHVGALVIVPITCFLPASYSTLLFLLPVYGFLTLGIHAGYAVYFPELFPDHLRSTGSGFCFNGGRLIASSALFFSSWLKSLPGMDLRTAVSGMSLLFLLGLVFIAGLPETRGQDLPKE